MATAQAVPGRVPVSVFWQRFGAFVIDFVILWAASWLVMLAINGGVYWWRRFSGVGVSGAPFDGAFEGTTQMILEAVVELATNLPYYVGLHLRYGATLGKMAFGLQLVDYDTRGPISLRQAWGRIAAYLLSWLVLGCGFLMALFQRERRALHDVITGTIVLKRRKLAPLHPPEIQSS